MAPVAPLPPPDRPGASRLRAPAIPVALPRVALSVLILLFASAGCRGAGDAEASAAADGETVAADKTEVSGSAPGASDPGHLPPGAPRRSALQQDTPMRRPSGGSDRGVVNLEGVGQDLGSHGARLRVVELMDYGCYYCRTFHLETFPALRAEYVETGEVFWKVIPFVMGSFPNSPTAASAALCAGRQDAFEPMSRRLFERQREWSRSGDAGALVLGYARAEGLDADAFETCLADPAIREEIEAHNEISRRLGVRGTPTFFILGHGRVPGAVPLDFFRDLLDRALDERR